MKTAIPFLALAALSGCGSFTHFQTARSLPAGGMTLDFQGAAIALNEGAHYASRFRVGAGKGFEAGVETDVISLAAYQSLTSPGGFGLIMGDLKWQFLQESSPDGKGPPFSAAVGFGGGSGFLTDFYFGQVTASRAFGPVEPYVAWRYQRIRLDVDLNDPDDVGDLEDSYISAVFEEAQDKRIGLHHLFIGVKFMVTDTIFLIPEVSWIFGDADGVGSIGLAFGFHTR